VALSSWPMAAEAQKLWDGGRAPRRRGLAPPRLLGLGPLGVTPWKIFESIGANLCNLLHFLPTGATESVQLVLNLDFGRSI